MPDQETPAKPEARFAVAIDLRDVLAGAGILMALGGAAAFHWGAALFVAGAGCVWLAWRLAR